MRVNDLILLILDCKIYSIFENTRSGETIFKCHEITFKDMILINTKRYCSLKAGKSCLNSIEIDPNFPLLKLRIR